MRLPTCLPRPARHLRGQFAKGEVLYMSTMSLLGSNRFSDLASSSPHNVKG